MNEHRTAESLKVGEGEWLDEVHARTKPYFEVTNTTGHTIFVSANQISVPEAKPMFCNRVRLDADLPVVPYYEECVAELAIASGRSEDGRMAELQARIDRKEMANEALVRRVLAQDAKIEGLMSDMRSLQAAAESLKVERDLLFAETKRLQACLTPVEPVKENPLHRAIRQSV